jgi:hypothetical protein
MPLSMVAAALLCWVVPTDTVLMVGSVYLGVIGVILFFDLIVRRAPLRVSTLFVTALALGYGGGTANSWFTVPRGESTLGDFLHHEPATLTHTMGSILFSMAILMAVGEAFENPLFGEEFELLFPTQAIVFISVGVGVLLVAYATGALNYMGATHGDTGQLGIFASFAAWLIGTLFAVTWVAALNVRTRVMRRYLMLLTILQFFLEIPIGRRSLAYAVVVGLISLRLGHYRFHWSWVKRIVMAGLLVWTLYAASMAFFYLRLAGFSSANRDLSIVDRATLALQYFEEKDYSEVKEAFSENVQTRTFILGFLADLEHNADQFTPGYGQALIGQMQSAIPSAIYPSKDRNFAEESLSNTLFGTTYYDEANSVLTAGALDFGMLGIVFYPLLLTVMLRSFFEFISQSLPTFAAALIIIAGIAQLLQPETNMDAYFIIMRNGLLFGSVVWFFIALPAFRLRKEN